MKTIDHTLVLWLQPGGEIFYGAFAGMIFDSKFKTFKIK